jgi:hypothetical protein
MENNHDELKAMQGTLMENQDWMSNMMEEIVAFLKTSWIWRGEKIRWCEVAISC